MTSRGNGHERYLYYNSLSILLKAIEGKNTTIDLRNESYVYGTVEQADGFMNITVKDCIFTDPRGNKYKFDTFFVQNRNIRCVHIPVQIPIIPAINNQLGILKNSGKAIKSKNRTFKEQKVKKKLEEDKAAVAEKLTNKNIEDGDKKKV